MKAVDYVLMLTAFLVLFLGLDATSIYIVDEARNTQAAWEMMQAKEWIVPMFNDGLRGDKPPLHYWMMRVAYWVGGKNAFAARFFSASFGFLIILGCYFFANKHYDRLTARWSILIMTSALYLPLQFRLGTPDPYLISLFAGGMLVLFKGWQEKRRFWLAVGYFVLGLATLAKGPVAPVMAALSISIFLLWDRNFNWPTIRQFSPFWGMVIVLAVALPWFIAVHRQTGGVFTQAFFVEHNLERFSTTKEGHGGGIWLVPLLLIVSTLPFSVFLPQAWSTYQQAPGQVSRYTGSIVLAFLVFFTLSQTKLPSYPAPAYPFFALLLAPGVAAIYQGQKNIFHWQMIFLLLLSLALPFGVYFGLSSIPEALDLSWQAAWLIPVPILVLFATVVHFRKQAQRSLQLIASAFVLLQILLFTLLLPQLDRKNHVQQSQYLFTPGTRVIAYHKFSPAYVFYHDQPIRLAKTAKEFEALIQQYGGQCPLVLTTTDRKNDIDCDQRLQLLFQQKDLFENPVTIIYRYEYESCL